MNLAARCPQCHTTFRIAPDQLKISEGLVRCGKCQNVFNANLYQVNLTKLKPTSIDKQSALNSEQSPIKAKTSPDTSNSGASAFSSEAQNSKTLPQKDGIREPRQIEQQDLSDVLNNSDFLDLLFSEFQIGWPDTLLSNTTEAETTDLNVKKRELLFSQKPSDPFIEKIELAEDDPLSIQDYAQIVDAPQKTLESPLQYNTEFTESLLRFDESTYDSQDFVVIDDDDEDIASIFFEDSLSDEFSFSMNSSVLNSDDLLTKNENKPSKSLELNLETALDTPLSNVETINTHTENNSTFFINSKDLAENTQEPLHQNEQRKYIKSSKADFKNLLHDSGTDDSSRHQYNIKKSIGHIDNQNSDILQEQFFIDEKNNVKDEGFTYPSKTMPSENSATVNAIQSNVSLSKSSIDTDEKPSAISLKDKLSYLETNTLTSTNSSSSEIKAPPLDSSINDEAENLDKKYQKISSSWQKSAEANVSFIKGSNSIWNKPIVKWLSIIASTLLLILLLSQIIYYRNTIVSYMPSTRPFLMTLSEPLGYKVNYPISFELNRKVTIDASSLNSLENDEYQLELVIRNREPYAIAMPSVELTLENTSGEIVAKKIFTPNDLYINQVELNPQEEILIRRIISVDLQGATNLGFSTSLLYL